MATTRIMPLHIGKGRTESRAISDIIDYVANPQKTDNGKLITSYGCDSRTADAEFLLAKRQYNGRLHRHRWQDQSGPRPLCGHLRGDAPPAGGGGSRSCIQLGSDPGAYCGGGSGGCRGRSGSGHSPAQGV